MKYVLIGIIIMIALTFNREKVVDFFINLKDMIFGGVE